MAALGSSVGPDPNLFLRDEGAWIRGLQGFLFATVIPLVVPGKESSALNETRLRLVDQEAMNVWIVTFTHESFNRNRGHNYETLEHLGDAAMKLAFDSYLIQRFPTITEAEATGLISLYLSKNFQSEVGRNLNLINWVRILIDRNIHVREDILEATFGALIKIGDKIKKGLGYVLCFNFIVAIFKDIKIDFELAKGQPSTRVKEIFEKLHWGSGVAPGFDRDEIGKAVETTSGWTMTLRFTQEALIDLKNSYRFVPPTNILGQATAGSKDAVEDLAFSQALQNLANYGYTWDWATQEKERKRLQTSDLAPYYPAAIARSKQDGYVRIDLPKPRRGATVQYAQLIGYTPEGQIDTLVTINGTSGEKIIGLQILALQKYAQQGRDRY